MKTKLIAMRWGSFTFPIKKGTPVSVNGTLSNDANAVGIVAEEVKEPTGEYLPVIVSGELNLAEWQGAYGTTYNTAALKAMDGICFLDANGTRTPNVYADVQAATTTTIGGVKKAANVPAAAGSAPTKAEYDALLTALKNAGIMVADS